MSKKDTVNVYWAPAYSMNMKGAKEWNMIYQDPFNLFTELNKDKNLLIDKSSYFTCPVTKNLFKNTYFFKNTISCKYEYDFTVNPPIINPLTENFINLNIIRDPNMKSYPLIAMSLYYILFSEEPLVATFSNPTFHKPEYINYGTCIPGEFDIGQWFRPYPMEIQLWNQKGIFELKEYEPLFYVKFNTDKKINLQRFVFNEKLSQYSDHCINYKNIFGFFHPLSKMYSKFKESKLNTLILKEIKNNLVEEIK
jgi:hypothetical protein